MKTINPFRFKQHIHVNASKSDAQRCLILAAFNSFPSKIYGLDESEDILSMSACLEVLGAQFHGSNPLQVQSIQKKHSELTFNVGESGFALRTLAFVSLLCSEDITIHGKGTLLKREQHQLIEILEQLGLQVESNAGKLPLRIQGKVTFSEIEVDGSAGSQAISGLCLLAPYLPNGLHLTVRHLTSKPYLDLTLNRMRLAGIEIEKIHDRTFIIPGKQAWKQDVFSIEGDWSGAANHIVGASISGEICLSGLQADSVQADKNILKVISTYGAKIAWKGDDLYVHESQEKYPFHTNIEDCPDLFPILVVLACAAKGTSTIRGIHRLLNKESNRLDVMCAALNTFGVPFQLSDEEILIDGNGRITGGLIQTHSDHRIAMAATIAASISNEGIILSDENCVSKSYPKFFEDLGL